jgi:hypothetical protein
MRIGFLWDPVRKLKAAVAAARPEYRCRALYLLIPDRKLQVKPWCYDKGTACGNRCGRPLCQPALQVFSASNDKRVDALSFPTNESMSTRWVVPALGFMKTFTQAVPEYMAE